MIVDDWLSFPLATGSPITARPCRQGPSISCWIDRVVVSAQPCTCSSAIPEHECNQDASEPAGAQYIDPKWWVKYAFRQWCPTTANRISLEYFLASSDTALQNFAQARLAHAANVKKEIRQMEGDERIGSGRRVIVNESYDGCCLGRSGAPRHIETILTVLFVSLLYVVFFVPHGPEILSHPSLLYFDFRILLLRLALINIIADFP